jgi:hypothetical protein
MLFARQPVGASVALRSLASHGAAQVDIVSPNLRKGVDCRYDRRLFSF